MRGLAALPPSPFHMAAKELFAEDGANGIDPIDLTIGDPRHGVPEFVGPVLADAIAGYGGYAPTNGTPGLRRAIADYLAGRYGLSGGFLDVDSMVLPTSGSREALFMVSILAQPGITENAYWHALMPNPGYPSYCAGALAAGANVHPVAAMAETGFMPDFASVPAAVLDTTRIIFHCSPANPQGSVASAKDLLAARDIARQSGAILVVDECYADIYHTKQPPIGMLQAIHDDDGDCTGVLVSHSLSKRSNLPGLRSGFMAGDAALIARFARLRHAAAVALPTPVCHVSERAWQDAAHVARNRDRYRAKVEMADAALGGIKGYQRPGGGFFIWLPVADDVAAARQLWQQAGIKTIPGSFLAVTDDAGHNPGAGYLRIALVADEPVMAEALSRIQRLLA